MPHGNLPDCSLLPARGRHLMTFVFPVLTLTLFSSIPSFHLFTFSINNFLDSANNAKSSAYNNSNGNPTRNSLDNASNTIANRRGLSTDPWCTPTSTPNPSLSPSLSSLQLSYSHILT